ncbi:putative diacylglycerol acyltransferase type 2b [Fimicolochytrium jonesii]|uniref:putative diacylglycerol acyltransferase type 2b n=1 Tax=Fimicolochytrium jonesii TaxID=1396493 RepID=UPI0022FE72BF|nr:putative diacylglycerol acyltransferase type 2b [Fimicolochytrium jonesii]KAI8823078.1 putative diacylglycerol acyltransferase type 2b [Fimicolochytrium jonesii]
MLNDSAPAGFVDAPTVIAGSVAAAAAATSLSAMSSDHSNSVVSTLVEAKTKALQIASVAIYSSLLYINSFVLAVLLYNWRLTWPFFVVYCGWAYLFDSGTPFTGGTDRMRFFRDWSFWNYFGQYFDAELVKTAELDPTKNYLFGYHPHGIYCYGLLPNFISNYSNFSGQFPGIKIRMTTLDVNYVIPLWREISMALGVVSVGAKSLKHILSRKGPGWSAMVVIGGADEALLAYPGTSDLILNQRKGFVKIAVQTGAALVPVFTFGENDLYWQVTETNAPEIRKVQKRVAKILTFSIPLMWGSFGLFPRKTRLVSVVGAPIHIKKQDNPSREYIAEIHQQYVDALLKLYNDHKDRYAVDRTRDLRIVR